MCALPIAPPTDADMQPAVYDCVACGVSGPVVVVAYPYGGGVLALCAACARDRAQLRAIVRALGSCPVRTAVASSESHTT